LGAVYKREIVVSYPSLSFIGALLLSVSALNIFAEKPAVTQPGRAVDTHSLRTTTPGGLSGLALPESFLQQIDDRITIDAYQIEHHGVAEGVLPAPRPQFKVNTRIPEPVRLVRANIPAAVAARRQALEAQILPPRGFRAPILENVSEPWAPRLALDSFSRAERDASLLIERRLAADGILGTLAQLIQLLGAQQCLADPRAAYDWLIRVGFPADLLHHFRTAAVTDPMQRPLALIEAAARRALAGSLAPRPDEPFPAVFDFQRSSPGLSWINGLSIQAAAIEGRTAEGEIPLSARFTMSTESGEEEIGLVRMQVGGGWRDGVVPGGSIDVVAQIADQFRSADFLISVAAGASAPFQSLITNSWRMRRRHQITLCEEAIEPSAWAQDNGKAGILKTGPGIAPRAATLLPRYACMDEGKSVFLPGESFLADGLRASGHPVIHSPLLFQGGNLLCIREPKTSRRLLVLGEGTVYRNVALGLSRDEVLAAFKEEFGADDCAVLPVVSYHLDFDVTFRVVGSELVAFVNDTPAAVRRVLELGIGALQRHGVLDAAAAQQAMADLAARKDAAVLTTLTNVVRRQLGPTNVYPVSLARAFVSDSSDEGAGNLQVFLLGLDLLETSLPPHSSNDGTARTAYLQALRRTERARQNQISALQRLGCRVVPVPSMQDLYRSINYLNGVQHRSGYIMPAFGGFYATLDQAAAAVFRMILGSELHIATIRTAECQRMHGAIHCTVSVYPEQ
jgi:hypothetical protein